MELLNNIPLVGVFLGVFLGFLLLNPNYLRGKRKVKITLILILALNIHSLLESYLYYNGYEWPWMGISYLHYHLIGALFLLCTNFLFKIRFSYKLWGIVLIAYTLLRSAVLLSIEEDVSVAKSYTPEVIIYTIDYLLTICINLTLLYVALRQIMKVKFAVELNPQEQVNYSWLKRLLVISIGIYASILLIETIAFFDPFNWIFYDKIETIFISFFSLGIIYLAIKFPIFSIYGDFEDLSIKKIKKYAKSSLKDNKSTELWKKLNDIMNLEKPYLNPEYRLNHLAEQVESSVHHVSQVINEKKGVSFSEFINQYRVKEAQELLSSEKADHLSILGISIEAGFNSKTAFYNTFKKITGLTPSEYKRQHKLDYS